MELKQRFTVATMCDTAWIDTHLLRYARLARRAMPDARLCLLMYKASATDDVKDEQGVLRLFDTVEYRLKPDDAQDARDEYNRVRMQLCSLFCAESVLYLDADIDVYADLSDIPTLIEKDLLWCQSPVLHHDWVAIAKILGMTEQSDPCANNGLLFLRRDMVEEYDAARAEIDKMLVNPRIAGMMAFNIMLRRCPEIHAELPYIYGHIWWDKTSKVQCSKTGQVKLVAELAKTSHFCNDRGKVAREALSARWIY